MSRKVVLAGGTGFVGRYLASKFSQQGYEVVIISRREGIAWHDTEGIVQAFHDAELLINLAGKSVNCRYHPKNRHEILQSRTETTKILGDALLACDHPPLLWINSSTATIYRHAEDRPMTEADGELGTGFSVDVAKAWEEVFFSYKLPHTRQVALRMAIVLGKDGGVFPVYRNLVRGGLGGPQGSGNQRFSWIHVEDVYQMILYLRDHPEMRGVYNCSSPYPVTNRELMRGLRNAMGMRFGLPSYRWMLEIGAVFLRTETELILKSRWVIPDRMVDAGFQFKYATLTEALGEIVH